MTRQTRLRVVPLLALAALLGARVIVPAAPLEPPVTLRVGTNEISGDAGIYVAMAKGYFKAEGLVIDLQPFDTAVKQIPPLDLQYVRYALERLGRWDRD